MADPVIINIPVGTWTLVATGVKTGAISILNPTNGKWYWTQRDTTNPAPTTELPEVKLQFQTNGIESTVAIDVYVYVKGTAGRVRVIL